jgi:hypothetical protein
MYGLIACFCDPHPDELLYSAWARSGDRVRYPYKTMVLQELFGSSTIRPNIDLPCYLKYFVDSLPVGHGYTVDYFIDHHTLLPFYGAFFTSERLKSIKEQMNSGDPSSLHYRVGMSSGRRGIPTPPWLRYCPNCVEEDRVLFGVCYWHRLHQVPGVELCPIHSMMLEQSLLPTRGSENGYPLVSAEQAIQLTPPRSAASSPFSQILMDIAIEISYLLEHPFIFQDPHLFPQRYRALLAQHDFITPRGFIRVNDFLKSFTEYYPQELLRTIHCEIKVLDHPEHTWIARLPQNNSKVYHPLYHILVIHFLDSTLERFLCQDHTLPSPFGDGPWPCLNPVCEYYQQRRIPTYQTKEVKVKGKVTGEFTCTCGYTYIRSGPDLSPDDIFQKGKVLSYGPVWEAKLRELWLDKQVSLKSLAYHLGVDPKTARRQAGLLDLALRQDDPNAPPEKTLPASNKKDRSWYRTQWLVILEEAKDEPLYVLRGRAKGIYSWLARNDKDWFAAHHPVRRMRRKTSASPARVDQRYTDYTLLDPLLAEAIRVTAYKLIHFPGRPVKVTRNRITMDVPEVRRLRRASMNRLPLAKQALQEVVESREALALRRIKWTLDRYLEEQSCPAQWKFLERAGLKARILQFQNVQKAFDSAMSTLSQFM